MLLIPHAVYTSYVEYLTMRGIEIALHGEYKKWLRYYLDFCDKYPVPESKTERVRLFCEKLREKKQSENQRQLATHAVSLYFEMKRQEVLPKTHVRYPPGADAGVSAELPAHELSHQATLTETARPSMRRGSHQYNEAGFQEKSKSPEWDELLATLAAEIKVRHYSRKTLKTYANWSRKFQGFLKDKPPQELSAADVKEYMTYLAVKEPKSPLDF